MNNSIITITFGDKDSDPDYENGKGRIVSYEKIAPLNKLKRKFEKYFSEKGKNLQAEGNYYYDSKKCGIGFHGGIAKGVK